ncbi:uncharacterized protein STEHIDRAFT_147275 [Stereum hirsutum FP-91666 SS1]|uniref:uncharacterized protein n=1 Tax=Stereum hirsutum (strain FP-91666) TaxID=721885 RepID=UPI000444A423|nr:uncharacterized protein STEHIDRAFT_147275 [Stereum hirsutum FP-91666 SS1]EIM86800.1 hypothetical protein STEHIDRAFT_147275 [Stereum hirsutum FP-91666 SS1]
MSSTNTSSIAGGLPTVSQDIAPSVIFLILYFVTNAVCIWRMISQYRKPLRMLLSFIRIQLFESVRVVTMILRIVGAVNYTNTLKGTASINESLIIAEQILLSVGYLMIASTLIKLTAFHEARGTGGVIPKQRRTVTGVLDLAIIVAIIFGIIAGTNYSKSLTDASTANSVRNDRKISAIIVLVVLALLIGYNALLSTRPDLPRKTSFWLIICSALLIVVPAYRLAQTLNPPSDSDSTGQKVAFYILQVAMEWLASTAILAVNAKEWCGVDDYTGLKTTGSDQYMMGEQTYQA